MCTVLHDSTKMPSKWKKRETHGGSGMYFTLAGKKEIELAADCPASEVLQAIKANIENKDGFFGKAPDKVFCGEEKDGVFSLGLNFRYFNYKYSPFERFLCEVRDDGEKCKVHLEFRNDMLIFDIAILIALAVYAWLTGNWKISAIFIAVITFGIIISFNILINKCMDEIEYIVEETEQPQ